jgi:glycosyltransferase involved in cell wall biosynthesis
MSREWVRSGHKVTVITGFPQYPTGVKRPEDRWVLTRRERVDGVDVVRTYVWATPNAGVAKRMTSHASFMMSAMLLGGPRVAFDRPDVVIATSPQLLCAISGYCVARALRVPYVFEVRDLWPESITAVGAMGDNAVVRGLKSVAAFLYRHSDRLVTVGDGYKRQIVERYGIPDDKIGVVTNGICTELFAPGTDRDAVRQEFGWQDRFVILYAGALGMAHGIDSVLEAARQLQSEERILFAIVGEGAEKANLQRQAKEQDLRNVQFLDQQPRHKMPGLYAACDLGLVTLRRLPLFQDVLPSKIFEYLAMERAIVIGVDGEARKLVEAAGAGVFVTPEDVPMMVQTVRALFRAGPELEEMGRRGRSHVVNHYDRKVLARKYIELLRDVCGR